ACARSLRQSRRRPAPLRRTGVTVAAPLRFSVRYGHRVAGPGRRRPCPGAVAGSLPAAIERADLPPRCQLRAHATRPRVPFSDREDAFRRMSRALFYWLDATT